MHIIVKNSQKDLALSVPSVKKIVAAVTEFEGQHCDEVGIQFFDSKKMCSLHSKYFNDPSPTDCISFPIDENPNETYRVLGEVFVCPKTAIDYTAKKGGNPYVETSLYLVHGLLHLMGYDDIDSFDRKAMRLAEKRHMRHLEKYNLLLKAPRSIL